RLRGRDGVDRVRPADPAPEDGDRRPVGFVPSYVDQSAADAGALDPQPAFDLGGDRAVRRHRGRPVQVQAVLPDAALPAQVAGHGRVEVRGHLDPEHFGDLDVLTDVVGVGPVQVFGFRGVRNLLDLTGKPLCEVRLTAADRPVLLP